MLRIIIFAAFLLPGGAHFAYAQADEDVVEEAVPQAEEAEDPQDPVDGETVLDDEAEAVEAGEDDTAERRRGVRRLGDVVAGDESDWSLDIPDAPPPRAAVPSVTLSDPVKNARLQDLLIRNAYESDDPEFQMEVGLMLEELESDARGALEAGEIGAASEAVAAIAALDDARAGLAGLRERVELFGQVEALLERAASALEAGNLVSPEGESAMEYFQAVLEADEENSDALEGLEAIQASLLENALALAEELDFEAADAMIEQAAGVVDNEDAVAEAREAVVRIRVDRISELDNQVVADIDGGRFDAAETGITQLIALGGNRDRIDRLRQSLEDARLYGGFEPGQEFSDDMPALRDLGPTMVVVPAGNFMMGSPNSEDDRSANEGPPFRVAFRRGFALGKTEVTVAQFQVFVEDTGHVTDAERQGWSRTYDADTGRIDRRNRVTWRQDYMGRRAEPDLPVVHVSWRDAASYADWLAEQTDRRYRLPSEAEFEYALRAGSQSRYWWGDDTPEEQVENLAGDGESSTARRRWTVAFRRYNDGHWGPAPVGSYPPNPFGLHDMGGNVMSWTDDCWHDSYVRAPSDGRAWVNPGCDRRVIRGGSWAAPPSMSRSAFRLASGADGRDARVGFRVARDL